MAHTGRNIVVVGTSAGGVVALQRLLGGLPADLPAAVFIVMHIGAGADGSLVDVLRRSSTLTVVEAENDAAMERFTLRRTTATSLWNRGGWQCCEGQRKTAPGRQSTRCFVRPPRPTATASSA